MSQQNLSLREPPLITLDTLGEIITQSKYLQIQKLCQVNREINKICHERFFNIIKRKRDQYIQEKTDRFLRIRQNKSKEEILYAAIYYNDPDIFYELIKRGYSLIPTLVNKARSIMDLINSIKTTKSWKILDLLQLHPELLDTTPEILNKAILKCVSSRII